jgi:predicted transcriptional regulator
MLTIKEIATQTGKTERTVRSWLKSARNIHPEIGTFEGGQWVFTEDEVKTVTSFGRNGTKSEVGVIDSELIEPESVSIVSGPPSASSEIIAVDIQPVTLAAQNIDLMPLEMAGDRYEQVTEDSFAGLGKVFANALTSQVNLALAQQATAVKAIQAMAANAALQKLGESQGHTGQIPQ